MILAGMEDDCGGDLVVLTGRSRFKNESEGIKWTAKTLHDFQIASGRSLDGSNILVPEQQIARVLYERLGTPESYTGTAIKKTNPAEGLIDMINFTYNNAVSIRELVALGEKVNETNFMKGHFNQESYSNIIKALAIGYTKQGAEVKFMDNPEVIKGSFNDPFSPRNHNQANEQIIVCAAPFKYQLYWGQIENFPQRGRQRVKDDGSLLEGTASHLFFRNDGISYIHSREFNETWTALEKGLRKTQKAFNKHGIPTRVVYWDIPKN